MRVYQPTEKTSDIPFCIKINDTVDYVKNQIEKNKTLNSDSIASYFNKTIYDFHTFIKQNILSLVCVDENGEEEVIAQAVTWFINSKLLLKKNAELEIPEELDILSAFWQSLFEEHEDASYLNPEILPENDNVLFIQSICVDDKYQNQGFARYLLKNIRELYETVYAWQIDQMMIWGLALKIEEEDKKIMDTQGKINHLLAKYNYVPYMFTNGMPVFFKKM